jgi:predicted CxxxxCH...CXXCH cytochrome family protein
MAGRWLAALGFVLGTFGPAHGQSSVSLLDTTGDVGLDPSLGIAGGRGLIAYLGADHLKVARCADVTCTSAVVSTLDSTGVMAYPALAVGTDDRGIVSYYDRTLDALKVAHCSDADCTAATITVVDPLPVLGYTAIALGSDGLPLIVYVRQNGAQSELAAAHCSNVACTSSTVAGLRPLANTPGWTQGFDAALAIGTDGRGLIAYVPIHDVPAPGADIAMAHCTDVACTVLDPVSPAASPAVDVPLIGTSHVSRPSLVVGADGKGLVSYVYRFVFSNPISEHLYRLRHCADLACTSFTSDVSLTMVTQDGIMAPLSIGADGKPWFVRTQNQKVRLARCDDAACETRTDSCAITPGGAGTLALARGADDEPLAAFYAIAGRDLGAIHGFAACAPSIVSVGDAVRDELDSGTLLGVPISLDTPSDTPATVDWATVPGTATAGNDYVAASGTLTFGPATPAAVVVEILGDHVDEPDEEFSIVLSNPQGLTLGDATGTVTLTNDDVPPDVSVSPCYVVEGTGSSNACVFQVSLSLESGKPIEVPYATQDGTATAGNDYAAGAGTLSLAPGTVQVPLPITITADSLPEIDETFAVALGTPVNATVLQGQAQAVILDDDGSSSQLELTHGATLTADLAAQPGPTADADTYRIVQPPLSSWEVRVDDVSGDVAPGLVVELLDANNLVLQSATAVGTGPAVSLTFQNRLTSLVPSQKLRVRSQGCTTDCGPDDVYRIRLFETTLRVPRFNNGIQQVTFLLLQNATGAPVAATIDFWAEDGQRIATQATKLPPHGLLVLDTPSVPGVDGVSGSATITSDAPYGGLTGKAVAVDRANGFSFDSPLEYRPR